MKATVKLELVEKVKSIKLFRTQLDSSLCVTPNPTVCIQRPKHSGMHCREAQPESYMSSLAIAVFSVPLFFLLYYYLIVKSQKSDLQTEPL